MKLFHTGPASLQLPDEARQLLIHWKYTSGYSMQEIADRMKVSRQTLERMLHDKGGAKRETHMRVMRFVRRLQKKRKFQ